MERISAYYKLAKPGIIYGNLTHIFAGSLFASQLTDLRIVSIVGVALGSAFLIGSACVINNIFDRNIDARMKRTKGRATVTREVSLASAWVYASVLLVVACAILWFMTNPLTLAVGLICHVWYTCIYTFAKYHTPWSTWIGTIPGALPIVAGYTAVSGTLSITAILLGVMLMFWQLVHFYAIALFRRSDYAAANVPVISVVKQPEQVLRSIWVWAVGYVLSVVALVAWSELPVAASVILLVAAVVWVASIVRLPRSDMVAWGRKVFGTSLLLPFVLIAASVITVVLA